MAANMLPLHIILLDRVVTLAEGFTVIVKVIGVPLQLLILVNIGVTVTVAITGVFPVLVAVKEGILPVPEAANPMDVIELLQLYVVVPPVLFVEKSTEEIVSPLHTEIFVTALTCANGLMVMVNVLEGPAQFVPPFEKVGVTVIVATIGLLVLFIGVKVGMFPVPEAFNPIPVVLFVQLYVVVPPVLVVAKGIANDAVPAQSTTELGWFTCAVGFTTIVNVFAGPVQLTLPFEKVGVTVNVTVIGAEVELLATNEAILPVPAAETPIVGLLLDQE